MGEQYGGRRDAIRWSKEQLADQVGLVMLHGRGTFVPPTKIDIDRAISWVHSRSCDER